MLLSCLRKLAPICCRALQHGLGEGGKLRTWEAEHPCTGSQNCFLCKTDMVSLRRIFVYVIDSDYMPE